GGPPPPPPGEVVRLIERYNAVPAGASNVVVAAEALAAAGAFDPALTSREDWDLWIRLSRGGGPRVGPPPPPSASPSPGGTPPRTRAGRSPSWGSPPAGTGSRSIERD